LQKVNLNTTDPVYSIQHYHLSGVVSQRLWHHVQHRWELRPILDVVMCALFTYEGWNFNSGNYLFTTDTK